MPVKLNSSGGGSVTLTTPSTATDYTATFPAATGSVVLSNTSGTATVTDFYATNVYASGTVQMGSSFKRNRIINGDMRVDQRNAGASVAVVTSENYTVDRWKCSTAQNSRYTAQQNAGSVTPPTGFSNYLGITSVSSGAPGATDLYFLTQFIEGYNISDLGWGTANAKSVTLSFWVYSSLTGAFGGALNNSGSPSYRSYPISYTISNANTWEYKTITIAGDTTGTWNTTTGQGIQLRFGLGVGSTYLGTAGAWAAGFVGAPTGSTNVIATNGATFYITGVQLEVGSVATPYERQIYSEQLAQCQRYCPVISYDGGANAYFGAGMAFGTTAAYYTVSLPVTPRVPPTGLTVSAAGHFAGFLASTATSNATAVVYGGANNHSVFVNLTGMAGLVGGNATLIFMNSTAAKMIFTGCEL